MVKNLPANAGERRDVGSIPGSGKSLGGRHGNPLQYSCLGNSMDRGAWGATVHRVEKIQTWLPRHECTHTSQNCPRCATFSSWEICFILKCFSSFVIWNNHDLYWICLGLWNRSLTESTIWKIHSNLCYPRKSLYPV